MNEPLGPLVTSWTFRYFLEILIPLGPIGISWTFRYLFGLLVPFEPLYTCWTLKSEMEKDNFFTQARLEPKYFYLKKCVNTDIISRAILYIPYSKDYNMNTVPGSLMQYRLLYNQCRH